jgi:hypothetical protein
MTRTQKGIIKMLDKLGKAGGMATVRCYYGPAMRLINKYPERLGHVKLKLGAEGLLPTGAKLTRVGLATHGCDRGWMLKCYAHDNSDGIEILRSI